MCQKSEKKQIVIFWIWWLFCFFSDFFEIENNTLTGILVVDSLLVPCAFKSLMIHNPAIHTKYRISLRSSSIPEPRYPLLKVVSKLFFLKCFYFLVIFFSEKSKIFKRNCDFSKKNPQKKETMKKNWEKTVFDWWK